MPDDFFDRFAAGIAKARQQEKPRSRLRRYPRPDPNLSAALLRARAMLAYHEPRLQTVTLTNLYEYSARRLMRDVIPAPARIAADYRRYIERTKEWWEELR